MHAVIHAIVEQNTPAWLEARKAGLGGSDAPVALGLSKWRTRTELFNEKRSNDITQESRWELSRGKALESLIRDAYTKQTGNAVTVPEGILRHPDYAFMLLSADGISSDGKLVECKVSYAPKAWGEPGTNEVPDDYMVQVQHALIVTGLQYADVMVSIMGNSPVLYHVDADAEIQQMVFEGEREFWALVQAGVEPEPVTIEESLTRYRQAGFAIVEAEGDVIDAYRELEKLQVSLKSGEGRKEELKAIIMRYLGERNADTLTYGGRPVVTWKQRKGAERIDGKALRENYPDIAAAVTATGEPTRTFLIK